MSNDMQPAKPSFDYGLVNQEQAMQLQAISIRLAVRVQRTAEEMLAMGADLREAKRVCKEDGTLFTAWCESVECPVGYGTAKRLMSIHAELGDEKAPGAFFETMGIKVLSAVTQTRDEDIRQALLEHIEREAGDGNKVTQKEITALKKALADAQKQSAELQDREFDARQALEKLKIERDKIAAREKDAREKKEQYVQDLIDADKKRKAMEAEYKAKLEDQLERLNDAEEVHREHLEEMRKQIAQEERSRPRTDEEEAAHQSRLNDLREQAAQVEMDINQKIKERAKLDASLLDLRKETALRDKILSDFAQAAVQFREVALRMSGVGQTLKKIQITDALFDQIDTIRSMASDVVSAMNEAVNV